MASHPVHLDIDVPGLDAQCIAGEWRRDPHAPETEVISPTTRAQNAINAVIYASRAETATSVRPAGPDRWGIPLTQVTQTSRPSAVR